MPVFIELLVKCLITILGDTCGLSVKDSGTKWPTAIDIRPTPSRTH